MQPDHEMSIALVAEELSARPDEGALKVLERLCAFLAERVVLRVFHSRGEAPSGIAASRLPFTRAGITGQLGSALRDFAPRLVFYVPSASITVNAMFRARRLRSAAGCPVALFGLQRRRYNAFERILMRGLRPDVLVVTAKSVADEFLDLHWNVVVACLGVDHDRFHPVPAHERETIRARRGWDDGRRVVLHVGHLRRNRGIDWIQALAGDARNRVVFVGSVSERGEEDEIRSVLEGSGVEVVQEYLPAIEEYYQAADAYVFPVRHAASAIDFPLSVLEAIACGVPVLTTAYGALPERLSGHPGVRFLDPSDDPVAALDDHLGSVAPGSFSVGAAGWDETFEDMFSHISEALP